MEVRRFLNSNNINIIYFVETRVKEHNAKKIQNKLGSAWEWEMNYSFSHKGRIWLGWRHSVVTFNVSMKSEQLIHGELAAKTSLFTVNFTIVYGLHTVEHRRPLWAEMVNVSAGVVNPWIFMGDFN